MGGTAVIRLAPMLVALMLALQLASMPARAALFDDDEARKRIDALKVRIDQLERSVLQRLDSLIDGPVLVLMPPLGPVR